MGKDNGGVAVGVGVDARVAEAVGRGDKVMVLEVEAVGVSDEVGVLLTELLGVADCVLTLEVLADKLVVAV